jgi:hypothetical protein
MITGWLASFFRYADISDSTLRATSAALTFTPFFRQQREDIAAELRARDLAAALERTIGEHACVWTARGGKS